METSPKARLDEKYQNGFPIFAFNKLIKWPFVSELYNTLWLEMDAVFGHIVSNTFP